MNGDIEVNESKRTIFFADGSRSVFTNVKWFNSNGTFLRIGCDQGYVLINTDRINYIIVEGERVR